MIDAVMVFVYICNRRGNGVVGISSCVRRHFIMIIKNHSESGMFHLFGTICICGLCSRCREDSISDAGLPDRLAG